MTTSDWRRVITECADLGVRMVQFIGGEPTRHPDLQSLVDRALTVGLEVEVFSNLVHVTAAMWDTFSRPGVRLACSYYSDDPAEHAAITRRNTLAQTKKNIAEAVSRANPLRVGVIGLSDDQRVDAAVAELGRLGVSDVGTDRLRHVGRGTRPNAAAGLDQLCGQCGDGKVAISPDGTVWPCVFTRWMPVGNVLGAPLAQVMGSAEMTAAWQELRTAFGTLRPCVPNMCNPQCGPSCSPACKPANNCKPVGACVPWYQ